MTTPKDLPTSGGSFQSNRKTGALTRHDENPSKPDEDQPPAKKGDAK